MAVRVGYIGLGLMGKPMARNLMKAGYELVVHNRSQGAVNELVAEGAEAAGSPLEVAKQVEFVFTNLPDSPDVEHVVLGESGIIHGSTSDTILVDNSTIKPETSRMLASELAKKGAKALDAPVSGGDVGAIEGTLAIMVGGELAAYEQALPLLEALGSRITYVGESGAGQVAKACNQVMVAAQMAAMGELLLLAKKSGVDPEKVIEAIQGGAAQCWTLDIKPNRLFAGNREPGFKSHMMYKDLGIVMDTARAYGMPLPSTSINTQLFATMQQIGMGDLDNSAVIGVLEILADVKLLS
jgi:2-hydroxy-3-oxopropionate reductase